MKCPFCLKEIDVTKNKPTVLFCPHCFGIIDKKFEEYSFPNCDFDDRDVVRYKPDIDKQIIWYKKHQKAIPKIEDNNKDRKNGAFFIFLMITFFVLGIIGTGILISLVHPIIGILFLMACVLVGTIITHKIIHPIVPEEKLKTEYVPIAYYGNEESFGYIEVNIGDYIGPKNHLINFEFVEISKNYIKDVFFNKETDEYCILLHKEVYITNNRKSDRIFIPDIFNEKIFDKMIY